ncbi:hypothetical protein WDU94_007344 [Cyamophila willieti]
MGELRIRSENSSQKKSIQLSPNIHTSYPLNLPIWRFEPAVSPLQSHGPLQMEFKHDSKTIQKTSKIDLINIPENPKADLKNIIQDNENVNTKKLSYKPKIDLINIPENPNIDLKNIIQDNENVNTKYMPYKPKLSIKSVHSKSKTDMKTIQDKLKVKLETIRTQKSKIDLKTVPDNSILSVVREEMFDTKTHMGRDKNDKVETKASNLLTKKDYKDHTKANVLILDEKNKVDTKFNDLTKTAIEDCKDQTNISLDHTEIKVENCMKFTPEPQCEPQKIYIGKVVDQKLESPKKRLFYDKCSEKCEYTFILEEHIRPRSPQDCHGKKLEISLEDYCSKPCEEKSSRPPPQQPKEDCKPSIVPVATSTPTNLRCPTICAELPSKLPPQCSPPCRPPARFSDKLVHLFWPVAGFFMGYYFHLPTPSPPPTSSRPVTSPEPPPSLMDMIKPTPPPVDRCREKRIEIYSPYCKHCNVDNFVRIYTK